MQKSIAIFLVCLIATSSAMTMKEQRLKAMQKLTYTSLFAEIQSQLTAGGPVSAILHTIKKFTDQIEEEQAEHDAMYAIQTTQCEEEFEFRNGEIADANGALSRATAHLDVCSGSLSQATVDLAVNQKDLQDTQDALNKATNIRGKANAVFEEARAKHEFSQSVIQGALEFLDELTAGEGSLIQLTQHTTALIQTGVKTGMVADYAPVIVTLAQMAASEEDEFIVPDAVGRVRDLIGELLQKVGVALQNLISKEKDEVDAFNILAGTLNKNLNDLKSINQRLNAHVNAMNLCVVQETAVIGDATYKKDNNQQLLNVATEMCTAFDVQYTVASEGRKQELDLLDIISQIATARLDRYADSASVLGGSVQEGTHVDGEYVSNDDSAFGQ